MLLFLVLKRPITSHLHMQTSIPSPKVTSSVNLSSTALGQTSPSLFYIPITGEDTHTESYHIASQFFLHCLVSLLY